MKCHELRCCIYKCRDLRTLIILNCVICKHTEKCVASVLIQCSEILELTHVVIHNDEMISKLTNNILNHLTLKCDRLHITDAGIQRFVSNLSPIRSLCFVEMFGEQTCLY